MSKMKLKILFIVPSLTVGGMERMQVTLANALYRIGYDITIMLLNPVYDLADDLDDGIRLIYKPYREFPIRRRLKYIWTFYDDGVWERRVSSKKLHKYYVGKDQYDVKIAFFRGLPVKILGFREKNVKHLAWVHSDFQKAVGYANNFKSLEAVKKAYSNYDQVICVSKEVQCGFEKVIGNTGNLSTVYNMLPIEEIKKKAEENPAIPSKKHTLNLVLVGRLMDSVKGQIRLIHVISKLVSEKYDVGLNLVGSGVDEKKIQEAIKKYNLEEQVVLVGNQKNPYPYIKQADVLVCASYFEGYNLTVAEALIVGTAVISTRCTGPCEILDDGKYGFLVENSEDGLYTGIKALLDQPELVNKYKEKARERERFFDEKELLNQILDLIEYRRKDTW